MFQLSNDGKQKVLNELKRYESKQSAVLPALYIGQKENNGFINAEVIKELSKVMEALASALEWLGAGAKTAVGYGRMPDKDKNEQTKICERIEQAAMSVEERMAAEVKKLTPDQLAKKFGRERNSTKSSLGDSWEIYLEQIISVHGDQIRGWKYSANPNEKKAYKTIFERSERS